jgi:hypothetical protein
VAHHPDPTHESGNWRLDAGVNRTRVGGEPATEGTVSGTTEIRYDHRRVATWCAVYSGAALLCAGFVACLVYVFVKVLRAADEGVLLPVPAVSGSLFGLSLLWLAARASRRYWRKFRRRSPVLTLTPDGFRDERPPPAEVHWADVRGLRLRTETLNGWDAVSVVEVQVNRGNLSITIVVDLLSLDRTPEEIFGLMERCIKTATR